MLPSTHQGRSQCWWGPLRPALLQSCWGGGCCAFTSPCSLQESMEKVRPSFIFLCSLHNGFLWEGLVRQSRRGGEEFRGSSSQPLLSVDGDMWLLQLCMVGTYSSVYSRSPLADAKGIIPPEQGPVGGEQWSEWLYFQGLEINCKIVHHISSHKEVCAKVVTFLPLLCTCTTRPFIGICLY